MTEQLRYCDFIDTSSDGILRKIEKKFSEYIIEEDKYYDFAFTSSGTTAILATLLSYEFMPGDEVITVSNSFLSTAEAIILSGAKPVYVDVDEDHLICVDQVEACITNNTRAIISVDMFGQPLPDYKLTKLKDIADRYMLRLVSDSAQSFGCSSHKDYVKYFDAICYSFNPIKNLGGIGDAGGVLTEPLRADVIRQVRNHGVIDGRVHRIGLNARLDSYKARVLEAKLPHVKDWIRRSRKISRTYKNELGHLLDFAPEVSPDHTYHICCVRVPNRDFFRYNLDANGIETRIHYREPLHTNLLYSGEVTPAGLLRTQEYAKTILSLPCHHTMDDKQQNWVIDNIREFYK